MGNSGLPEAVCVPSGIIDRICSHTGRRRSEDSDVSHQTFVTGAVVGQIELQWRALSLQSLTVSYQVAGTGSEGRQIEGNQWTLGLSH